MFKKEEKKSVLQRCSCKISDFVRVFFFNYKKQVLNEETKLLVGLLTGEKSMDEISTAGFCIAGQKYVGSSLAPMTTCMSPQRYFPNFKCFLVSM